MLLTKFVNKEEAFYNKNSNATPNGKGHRPLAILELHDRVWGRKRTEGHTFPSQVICLSVYAIHTRKASVQTVGLTTYVLTTGVD